MWLSCVQLESLNYGFRGSFEACLVPGVVPAAVVVPAWYPHQNGRRYNLVVRAREDGEPCWEAKWRVDGRQVKRRLGRAWLVRDADGGWARRRGRPRDGALD
jgi:hypothetical protein